MTDKAVEIRKRMEKAGESGRWTGRPEKNEGGLGNTNKDGEGRRKTKEA